MYVNTICATYALFRAVATLYLWGMDSNFFRAALRRRGLTQDDIASAIGRDRSVVSRILSGRQQLTLDHARVIAAALELPLADVLTHAGQMDETEARPLRAGFAESDATPWTGRPGTTETMDRQAALFGGGRPGIDVWTVNSRAMILGGYLPGDQILVDTHQSERCRAGDVVIAQVYDSQTGTATTVLRRYEPPVLIAASPDPDDQRALTVDWRNVAIRGKIIASWRTQK